MADLAALSDLDRHRLNYVSARKLVELRQRTGQRDLTLWGLNRGIRTEPNLSDRELERGSSEVLEARGRKVDGHSADFFMI